MRNWNLLKSHVSEICVKQICVNQGWSICMSLGLLFLLMKSKNQIFGWFLKKLCLYFAREGMVIDLVF